MLHPSSQDGNQPRNELLSAVSLASFSLEPESAMTFCPEEKQSLSTSWASWLVSPFESDLAGHILQCHRFAGLGGAHEIKEADSMLTGQFSESISEASRAEGRRLLTAREGGRALGVLQKYTDAVVAGETPGHFATALAVHSAVYNVPALSVLLALASFEWRAGGGEGMLPSDTSGLLLVARRCSASLSTPLSSIS